MFNAEGEAAMKMSALPSPGVIWYEDHMTTARALCRELGQVARKTCAGLVLACGSATMEAPQNDRLSSSPPATEAAPERVTFNGHAMGTQVVFVSFCRTAVECDTIRRAFDSAFLEIQRLEALMSTWRPASELSEVNRMAGIRPVRVSEDTFAVLSASLDIARRSEGVFDITFESMKGVWEFDNGTAPRVPAERDVLLAKKAVDYRRVVLNDSSRTALITHNETKVGLGGIAKGYAVDRAASVLRKANIASFLVQAGGDLYAAGTRPDGAPFRVGIRDPRNAEGAPFASLDVTDHAFSTAGDYERAFVQDGKRYHHIIDPRTGYPAAQSRSVTIWAKDAFTADALDDAVFILGPEKGLPLVEQTEDCGAVIVDSHNKVWISSRLQGRITQFAAPTDIP